MAAAGPGVVAVPPPALPPPAPALVNPPLLPAPPAPAVHRPIDDDAVIDPQNLFFQMPDT